MTEQQTGTTESAERRSPLHDEHVALGANLTSFGGWLMPLRYTSDLAEHRAVREAAGLFDLSHMGEIEVAGPQAAAALDHALVGNLSAVAPGRARYTMICQEDGAVLDDLVVYRLADERFLVVANAGTPTSSRASSSRGPRASTRRSPTRGEHGARRGPGPRAEEIVAGLTDPADPAAVETVRDLRYYAAAPLVLRTDDGAVDALVARTGYTGRTASSCSCPRTAPPTCGAPCSPRVRRSASSRRDCPRATRCAWRRGCRCTGTSSTPRPRRTRRGSVAS